MSQCLCMQASLTDHSVDTGLRGESSPWKAIQLRVKSDNQGKDLSSVFETSFIGGTLVWAGKAERLTSGSCIHYGLLTRRSGVFIRFILFCFMPTLRRRAPISSDSDYCFGTFLQWHNREDCPVNSPHSAEKQRYTPNLNTFIAREESEPSL